MQKGVRLETLSKKKRNLVDVMGATVRPKLNFAKIREKIKVNEAESS